MFIKIERFFLPGLFFLARFGDTGCFRAETLTEVRLRQVKIAGINVLLAFILLINLFLHHLDVCGAALHGLFMGSSGRVIGHCELSQEGVLAVRDVEI